jgi:hypothetical protein
MAYPNKLRHRRSARQLHGRPRQCGHRHLARCKLNAETTTPDGTPALVLASATERGSVVTLQPIAAGAYGAVAP